MDELKSKLCHVFGFRVDEANEAMFSLCFVVGDGDEDVGNSL